MNKKLQSNNPFKHVQLYTVCDKWKTFEGFLVDMGQIKPGYRSLRLVNGVYEYNKRNCFWATSSATLKQNIALRIDCTLFRRLQNLADGRGMSVPQYLQEKIRNTYTQS